MIEEVEGGEDMGKEKERIGVRGGHDLTISASTNLMRKAAASVSSGREGMRVGPRAGEALRDGLEEIAAAWGKEAVRLAGIAHRKTVMAVDVKAARYVHPILEPGPLECSKCGKMGWLIRAGRKKQYLYIKHYTRGETSYCLIGKV